MNKHIIQEKEKKSIETNYKKGGRNVEIHTTDNG